MDKLKFRDWKTTIIGALLIVAGIVSVLTKLATWTEAGIAITAGIGLLAASDSKKK